MTDHPAGQRHPRRILLAVTGLSPQIVTETLYALCVRQNPSWIPTEIHLVTTGEGARRARLALLSDRPGWFRRFLEDYHLPAIQFGETNLHQIRNPEGEVIDDIRTPADNQWAADRITELVRRFSADPDSALHVSIAGGRKTMGYYLGYALSLYGRPQDRLSHVLVTEPFESCWNFFYPTPYRQVIETSDRSLADTQDAEVTLAEIPFVSLRDGLPSRLLQGQSNFTDTVAAARKALQPPRLVIDRTHRRLAAGDEIIAMSPADLAFFSMLARRRRHRDEPVNFRTEGLGRLYLTEYAELVGRHSGDYDRAEQALTAEDLKDWFEQRKSKTNRALKSALGERLAQPYLIKASGKRPHTRYGLDLPPEAIAFADGKLAGNDTTDSQTDTDPIQVKGAPQP